MEIFEYFFECYFNQSANYNELEQLIDEFYNREKTEVYSTFVGDVKQIIADNDWELVKNIAKDKGGRILSEEKVKSLMGIISGSLKI